VSAESVSTVTRLRPETKELGAIPCRDILQCAQTGCGAHPDFCSMGNRDNVLEIKRPKLEAEQRCPSSTEFNSACGGVFDFPRGPYGVNGNRFTLVVHGQWASVV
jgi:hypothetical protein